VHEAADAVLAGFCPFDDLLDFHAVAETHRSAGGIDDELSGQIANTYTQGDAQGQVRESSTPFYRTTSSLTQPLGSGLESLSSQFGRLISTLGRRSHRVTA
jgi:hypothetical protein